MIKLINTAKGHQPIGPYSQAVIANGFIFVSGTAGVNPKTGKLATGLENQTRQIFSNIKEVLLSAGSDLSQVIKVTIFLKSMKNFIKMNHQKYNHYIIHDIAHTQHVCIIFDDL